MACLSSERGRKYVPYIARTIICKSFVLELKLLNVGILGHEAQWFAAQTTEFDIKYIPRTRS